MNELKSFHRVIQIDRLNQTKLMKLQNSVFQASVSDKARHTDPGNLSK